jgi:hypothetical protein
MNDSHVSVVSLNTVLSCQAYILFYSKSVPAPAPAPAPAAAPKAETASTAATGSAGEKVSTAALGPAVLVRTPAATAAGAAVSAAPAALPGLLPTPAVVQTRERSNSEGLTSEKVDAEVAAQSSDCINALFADAAVTDGEGVSSENSDEAGLSRLHRGGFKFYAPYR